MSVPASNLIKTIAANVDNEKLSDEEFREFVRNSLPICDEIIIDRRGYDLIECRET